MAYFILPFTNGFTKRMRPKTDRVLPEYIGYYMRMPSFRGEFQAFSTMTTRASLKNEDLLSLEILLPPLETQRRIGDILSAYDDLIESNQKQIKLLEEAAQRLYKEWFVDLRFPGHENVRVVDGVPEGWDYNQIQTIAPFVRGKTITGKQIVEGNVPVVAGGIEPAYYHNRAITDAPVITVSGSGANAGFVKLYYKKIWASDCSYTDVSTTKYIYFVYCLLRDSKQKIEKMQKGSAQPHVYAKDINALYFLCPNAELLFLFESIVHPLFDKISRCFRNIELARQARDRLLPKLMSGELEV